MSEDFKMKLNIEIIINLVESHMKRHDKNFRVFIPGDGGRIPVLIENERDVLILAETDALERVISACNAIQILRADEFKNPELFSVTAASAKVILKTLFLRKSMRLLGEIKPYAFKSEKVYTFCRVPFDPSPEIQACPTWDRLLSNYTNVPAIKMWFGSLFVDSDRSQYLWLYGSGKNGKSTLSEVVASSLKGFVRFEQTPKGEDKYWTHGLLGKRLIVFDDCSNYGFVKKGLFKSLTGASKVRIEQKYGDPYDTELSCKCIFTSNESPLVSNDSADQRRLIFSSIKQVEFEYDPTFKPMLKDELPNFISNCVLSFNATCSDGRPIPCDTSEAEALGDTFHESIESWVDNNFEFSRTDSIPVSKFRAMVDATRLSARDVYRFLESKGVVRSLGRNGHSVSKILSGIRQRVYACA
jgi:hypothetical protein